MEVTNKLELAILGLCMNGQAAVAFDAGIGAEMFTEKNHVEIYEAIRKCFDEGTEVNLPNVGIKLSDHGTLTVLMEICEKAPVSQNVVAFIDEVRKSIWVKSTYLKLANIAKMVKAWKEFDPIESIKLAIEEIKDLGEKEREQNRRTDDRAVYEWIENIERDIEKGGLVGITTGITELDLALGGGMRPGQLITVAARTGVGKTALATNMALSAAKQGHRVQYFSIELMRDEIIDRMACACGEINTHTMVCRKFSSQDLDKIKTAAEYISSLPITIETTTKRSWENVESLIRREKRLKNLRIAFIDYIQQFKLNSKRMQSKREEITHITAAAKELALELEITIVMVAQLNRNANDEPNAIPEIRDLKESGSIEQDSNTILLLYNTADDKRMGVMVGKNRSGKKDRVVVPVDLSINKFYEE